MQQYIRTVKNRAAYRLLFTANVVSGFAQGITMLAIPWYFSTQLGKPELFGTIYGLVTILMIFWGLYAGALIDRFSRKWVFFGVNMFGLLLLSSVSIYGFLNDGPGVLGAILVFAGTILIYNIHYPALYAFGQEISERAHYSRFTSWVEIIGQSTSIASGAIGAILLAGFNKGTYEFAGSTFNIPFTIQAWRLEEIFLADALTYAVGLLLIYFIRYTPISVRIKEKGSTIKSIQTGINFLRENPLILLFGNASYSVFVVLLITVQQLLPVYTNQHLKAGAGWYAMAEMLYSIGAMLAGVSMIWAFRKKNLVFGVISLMVFTVVIYVLSTYTISMWVFALICVTLGLCNAGIRVLRTTWLFNYVPNQNIGRVSSAFQTVNILLRGSFSLLFALPFFNRDGQIIYAYLICATFVGISIIPLIVKYKQLVNFEVKTS